LKISSGRRRLKVALWFFGGTVVLVLIAVAALMILSRMAVSDYRGDTAEQLNSVIKGETSAAPIKLNSIPLGDVLNQDYRRVKSLDGDYQNLLNEVKSYVAVLSIHDSLVEQYNAGVKGEKPLGGDLLILVKRYQAVFENRFPERQEIAKAASDLSIKITSTTDFDAVSADIDSVLLSGDKFLSETRERLNESIVEFQKKVN
jgi:hypothetical protein